MTWQVTSILVLWVAGLVATACARGLAPEPSPPAPVALASPSHLLRFPSPLVVSVLAFEDRTGAPDLAWLKTGLPDLLMTELARLPSLIVVQRARLDAVIREQALHLSGRVADESAVRVGRLVGATVLVTGSVILLHDRVRIDAQLVGVEQGTILGTAMVEGPKQDTPTLARLVAEKVVELFQQEGGPVRSAQLEEPERPLASPKAPSLFSSRAEQRFQELAEHEQVREGPSLAPPSSQQPGTTIKQGPLVLEIRPQAVPPLLDRLLGSAFEVVLGQIRTEPGPDGLTTLRVPVRLGMRPAVVEQARDLARELGGELHVYPEALEIALKRQSQSSQAALKALASSWRLYLRLVAADGRTLAIYSGFRHWRLANWITVIDHKRIRIELGNVVTGEGVVQGLSPEQVASLSSPSVSLEAVRREEATVRVERVDPLVLREPSPQRPLVWGEGSSALSAGIQARPVPKPEAVSEQEPILEALRAAIERLWDPPITERAWGPGHLPSNERATVLLATIRAGIPSSSVSLRVIRTSGDRQFDEAAVAAAEGATSQWWSKQEHAFVRHPDNPRASESGETLVVRMSFRLLHDLPTLDLTQPPAGS